MFASATERCFDQQLFERFAHLDFSFVGRRQVNMPPLENTRTKTINGLRARRDSCATPERPRMNSMLKMSQLIDGLNERIGRYLMWLVLAAVVISAANAVVRKAFDTSSNAFLEIQWYLFAAVVLWGSAYTMLRQGHVKIDVIIGRFSKRTQIIVECLGIVFFLLPFVYKVNELVWPLVLQAYNSGEMSQNAGGLIRWPVYALVPTGFILLGLQGISELIKRIGFLQGMAVDPTQPVQTKTAEEELAEEILKHQVAPEVVNRVEDSLDMHQDQKLNGSAK
jgi:TRAP-type mannitol/chloroaromatic compound transport system permease small subunit